MVRGRKPFVIDKDELQTVITAIEEGENPPDNRTRLWAAVASTSWALRQGKNGLSPQMAMLKAKDFGLQIKTPVGQRGRSKGTGPVPNSGKRKRKRFLPEAEPLVKKKFSQLGEKVVERLCDGKISAAVKAMCWDCSGGSKAEVARCACETCPLWPHRPWRKASLSVKTEATKELHTPEKEGEKKNFFPLEIVRG